MLITPNLIRWQYEGYAKYHANRVNLFIHILTAPIFFAATVSLTVHLALVEWPVAAASFGAMVFVLLVQGFGHKREKVPPERFQSPLDFIARFSMENLFTFWRFVFSGKWRRQLNSPE
ncbi:Mpo1-like protein [Turneriella parva]|uniref:Terminase n=1 Tax=Turneriella parva (strain ATCC BAA-1111 / DSM 21527 / NCTC 11395 / H) TaxID=869212 RepID=I4B9D0_TURPD|nr:Mpo1-like protein [Turneriella parva]AFM13887.1 hypothetical protein Turpa_3248 [Turneriella parva DSM 21527]